MSHDTLEIPRLVTAPREAFLRKEETKLRSLALPLKADPAIAKELNAIEMAEDLFDIHEIAAEKQRRAGNQAWTKIHELNDGIFPTVTALGNVILRTLPDGKSPAGVKLNV